MTQKWDKCSWKPLMTSDTRESDMPRHAGANTPLQPQTEFLLFLFFAVSPSGCLDLRGNPLSLHSVPHVLVVVLTVTIQDSLPTPSCRQLFLYSIWVSNIWTATPTVEGWKDGWKGEECCALWEKDRRKFTKNCTVCFASAQCCIRTTRCQYSGTWSIGQHNINKKIFKHSYQ